MCVEHIGHPGYVPSHALGAVPAHACAVAPVGSLRGGLGRQMGAKPGACHLDVGGIGALVCSCMAVAVKVVE